MFKPLNKLQVCLVVAAAVGAAACHGAAAKGGASERIRSTYDKSSGRLTRLEYDSNGDGKIDTWGYMDGMRVVRVEIDEDGDGKIDRWEFHKDVPGASARGSVDRTLEHIERATRHDGKVSRWEYFENGQLSRVQEDTDGDGRVDKWEQYTGGTLAVMALDTSHAGRPDRRLIYRADGSLDHIETDRSGSGTFTPIAQ
jgi:hypothetical protein